MKVPSVREPGRAGAAGPAVAAPVQPSAAAPPRRGVAGFFRSLFNGERSLAQLLWIDMIVVASAISLSSSAIALMLYAVGVPAWLSLALWALPIPYNLTIFTAVWIAAGRERDPAKGWIARAIALGWLPLFMVL